MKKSDVENLKIYFYFIDYYNEHNDGSRKALMSGARI